MRENTGFAVSNISPVVWQLRRNSPVMADTFPDILARLNDLSDRLKRATNDHDRRALLKQFRAMLDRADKASGLNTRKQKKRYIPVTE
jgi:hypothetical protein